MPRSVPVTWFVEPLNAYTSRAIADFLESGADAELHEIEVGGVTRSMYRLLNNHQREVLEESRDTLNLRFRIIRERNGKKEDITSVMRSRDRRHHRRPRRVMPTIEQLKGAGLIQSGSTLRAKNGPQQRVRS